MVPVARGSHGTETGLFFVGEFVKDDSVGATEVPDVLAGGLCVEDGFVDAGLACGLGGGRRGEGHEGESGAGGDGDGEDCEEGRGGDGANIHFVRVFVFLKSVRGSVIKYLL